jgi:hypothetical protein
VPRYPEEIRRLGIDPEYAGGRFNMLPAIALGTGEGGDDHPRAEDVIREVVGEWILEEHPQLGRGEGRDGSMGRGAEGWVAVVQWIGEADGVVDLVVAAALAKVLHRLREWRSEREAKNEPASIEISRGTAALVAAAHTAEAFREKGSLLVEAVEEPSSIAGWEVMELSYVGLEPWIVLLRNDNEDVRYVVVVMPDGTISGALRVPFLPFESMFLRPVQ